MLEPARHFRWDYQPLLHKVSRANRSHCDFARRTKLFVADHMRRRLHLAATTLESALAVSPVRASTYVPQPPKETRADTIQALESQRKELRQVPGHAHANRVSVAASGHANEPVKAKGQHVDVKA